MASRTSSFSLLILLSTQGMSLRMLIVADGCSVGECPQFCYLTKYAAVNLTFPGTDGYECDTEMATCEQRVNTTLRAPVYGAAV